MSLAENAPSRVRSKQQDQHESRNHGRHGKGQVDHAADQTAAPELLACQYERRECSEDQVEREDDQRDFRGEGKSVQRFRP